MEEPRFSRGPARRPILSLEPLIQWATGLQTSDKRIYAGWFSEQGKNPDFDGAMDTAGFSTVKIRHGSGKTVSHWAIPIANFFVLADGVQTIGEMSHTDDRIGIAFGWQYNGRPQSVLYMRVQLRELLELGFDQPLLVCVKSTLTGDLINALMRQYDVLDAIDAIRKTDGKPPLNPPFCACSIPIGPGAEVSRGGGGQSKEITPPTALVPTTITKDYVIGHWLRREWQPYVEGRIDQTIAWSITRSKQIGSDPTEYEPE